MSSHKADTIALGILAAVALPAGYWLGSRNVQFVFENMNFLLHSERNLEVTQNLKALDGLEESRVDDTIRFLQARVAGALKYEGIETATLERAREYQRKHCKSPCLDLK
jgi:hypothetical protein